MMIKLDEGKIFIRSTVSLTVAKLYLWHECWRAIFLRWLTLFYICFI